MQRPVADEVVGFIDSLRARDDDDANRVLEQIRARVAGPTRSAAMRGYARALIADAMHGSNGPREAFSEECIATLSASYNHPPLGGAGCWAYESPLYFLDTPNPPTLGPGEEATRRFTLGQAGAGGVRIVGLLAVVRSAASGGQANAGSASVQIAINGDRDALVTNGRQQVFMSMAHIANNSAPYFPFSRLVSSRDFIDVVFRSNVTVGDLIPEITFVVGPLPYLGRGVRDARELVLESLRNSWGQVEEIDTDCVNHLWALYQSGQRTTQCGLSFESPTRFMDAQEPDAGPLALAPGEEGTRRIVFTSGAGLMVGLMGSVREQESGAPVNFGFCSVQLSLNGGEFYNINGAAASFTNYQALFKGQTTDAANTGPWFPFRRLVTSNDFLDVRWRNDVVIGGATILPELTVAFGRLAARS